MNNPVHTVTTRLQKHPVLVLTVLILFILLAGYGAGYRFGPGASISKAGHLTIQQVPTGGSVYVDQKLYLTVDATSSPSVQLVRGNHAVIVSVPGDNPWNTIVPINSATTTFIAPIFVRMKVVTNLLEGDKRAAALAAIATTTLPTKDHPLSMGSCVVAYVDANRLIADVATSTSSVPCTPPPYLCTAGVCGPTIIFAPISTLTLAVPLPGRHDAFVVEFGNTLYVISIDPRTPQFFAPVLTGPSVTAGTLPDGTVVVESNGITYSVEL
jgi:hypothetical protein